MLGHIRTHTIRMRFSPAIAVLAMAIASRVEASPTLTYNLTNLGQYSSWRPNYGSDAGGGLVFAADGSSYRFNPSATPANVSTAGLPRHLGLPEYVSVGMSVFPTFHMYTNAYQNGNGLTVYFEAAGVGGHSAGAQSGMYAITSDGNGGWEQDSKLLGFVNIPIFSAQGDELKLAGINKLDQIAFKAGNSYGMYSPHDFKLYDSQSGTFLDLGKLVGEGWSPLEINSLDDEGRILLTARTNTGYGVPSTTELLLLTPTNLDAGPISVPEPSLIAFAACIAAGIAIRRVRRSRTA